MENLRQAIADADAECLVLEPAYFDAAAIDLVPDEDGNLRVRYDSQKIIALLMEHDDMDHEDALEWFSFNIECAYLGKGTPIYIDPEAPEDDEEE